MTSAGNPIIEEGAVGFREHRMWYRWTRPAAEAPGLRAPLVVVHGGPGGTHDYLLAYAQLAARGRPVLHFDQVGNGRSSRVTPDDVRGWSIRLFEEQLAAIVADQGLEDGYHVLGHSWGGMVAAEHAFRRPGGLRSVVLASTPASIELYAAEVDRLRAELPPAVERTLRRHEAAGTTDSAAYQEATQVFYRRHVCRLDEWPDELVRSFAAVEHDPTVYVTMNGPNEFRVVGTIAGWSIVQRIPAIRAPVLVLTGVHDEVGWEAVRPFLEGLPGSTSARLPSSSHVPHLEEPAACLTAVESFLSSHD